MAESVSVKAILSAVDKGFSSTLKGALDTTNSLASTIKSGFAFGILTGAGQAAFNALTNGAKELVGEINDASASWKTFAKNMEIIGKGEDDIKKVESSLKEFAQQTVYSSSDMATTYAQLEAVGVDSCLELVKGFGGLAAAAENPQQAMKTLSTQATQMAAKPKVAWADFKLMLEQTPAGISAVAKEMGMTTSELVAGVQDSKIATDKFFDAIKKVGTSEEFTELATEAKTMEQAMDGLKETLANKLLPAFDVLSKKGIGIINAIADKLGGIPTDKITNWVSSTIDKLMLYWEALKESFAGTGKEVWNALKTVAQAMGGVFGSAESIESFKTTMASVADVIKKIAAFATENADKIAKLIKWLPAIAIGIRGLSIAKAVAPLITSLGSGIGKLIGVVGGGDITNKLFGLSKASQATGAASSAASGGILKTAQAVALMGVGILAASVGFALLAQSAIALAQAGPAAIAVMFGLIGAIAGLAVVFGIMGSALTLGAAGMLAFGAAVALVGAGVLLASVGLSMVAKQLPTITEYGLQAAQAIIALGGSLTVFAAGALAGGAAALALGAGVLVAAAGFVALGGSITIAAAGGALLTAALLAVNASMKTIARNADRIETSLKGMNNAVNVVESALDALGDKASSAMDAIKNAFDRTEEKAKTSGENIGKKFANGMTSELNKAKTSAKNTSDAVNTTLRNGYSGAHSAGAYISTGFANGMKSQLSTIKSVAAQMASAAEAAIRAKAKIHSPSKVSTELGRYWGEGYANGLLDMVKDAWNAAQELVCVPQMSAPNFALAYGGELSAEYGYTRKSEYNITVVSELDGKEVGRGTAKYVEAEINKKASRDSRKQGKL